MRIIGGAHSGRVLKPPLKSWPTRPTTDIAKEALYNILMNRIEFEHSSMLDLFGGTGAHALEFLSRGCKDVNYVDNYAKCVLWVKEQISYFGYEENCSIFRMDVSRYLKRSERQFDIVIADPPYALSWIKDLPDHIFTNNLLTENGILVVEHGSDNNFKDHPNFYEIRKYGQTRFSFFSR